MLGTSRLLNVCRHVGSAIALWAVCCCAQAEEELPGFHETIRNVQTARAKIRSYDLVIKAEGGVKNPHIPVLTSSGKLYVPDHYVVAYTLEIARDAERDRILVARQDVHEDAKTKKRTTGDWHVFSRTPDHVLHGRKGISIQPNRGNTYYRPSYCDPLALGLGFMAEFQNGDPWQVVTNNYLEWGDNRQRKWVRDGVLRFTSPDYEIDFDLYHDYWPVHMIHHHSHGKLTVHTTITLQKVQQHWLPKAATVEDDDHKYSLTFDWISLNTPVDDRFDVPNIADRYQLQSSN